jgi:hypothetical protein
VSGQVVDEHTGAGLRGAEVEARPSGRHTFTDEHGSFRLPLPPGDHVLVVTLLGYRDDQKVVTLTPDAATVLVFRLRPDPVLLEGIRVVADRFESRRHSIPLSSRVLDRERLVRSGGQNLAEFVLDWGGVFRAECPGRRGLVHQGCVRRRGRVIQPTVYVDDQQAMGGVDQLMMFQPGQMHHVEIYGLGQMIRVYTVHYVEAVAEGKRRLSPLMW